MSERLPKITDMYAKAEADARHWRKKYREAQDARIESQAQVERLEKEVAALWEARSNFGDALEAAEERIRVLQERVRVLGEEKAALNRSVSEHHNIAYLSEEAIKESIGGPCQICARAQKCCAGRGAEGAKQ